MYSRCALPTEPFAARGVLTVKGMRMKLYRTGISLVTMLVLSACAATLARTHVPTSTTATTGDIPIYQFTLPQDAGYVLAVVDEHKTQFVVEMTTAHGTYELAYENAAGVGAMFGSGNAYIYLGTLADETRISDARGHINLWSIHPARLVQDVAHGTVVIHHVDTGATTRVSNPVRIQ